MCHCVAIKNVFEMLDEKTAVFDSVSGTELQPQYKGTEGCKLKLKLEWPRVEMYQGKYCALVSLDVFYLFV